MFRRFKKSFTFKNDAGQKVTVPRNWAGELPDQVAADADRAGATLIDKVKRSTDQSPSGATSIDDMTKGELIVEAALRNVEIKTSDKKADILAALKEAEKHSSGPKPIDDMTKDELIAEVALHNVAINSSDEASTILAALKAAEQKLL